MDVAASGGYYVALTADRIVAHPTTITGSIGVIFMVPKVSGLMDKLGLALEVSKSGKEKDMASPFRPSTEEEKRILQTVTDGLGKKFLDLVAARRKIDPKTMAVISGARIYLADEALELKLIDRIGYMSDALSEAKSLAGLPKGARVVAYRRGKYPDDNIYNTAMSGFGGGVSPLTGFTLPDVLPAFHPGFYYLWAPGAAFK
jgi:protease-4